MWTMRVSVWRLLFVVLGLAPAQLLGEAPEPSEESAVAVVEVPVLATGRDGAPVTDLRVDELEVYEDGKRQEITVFVPLVATDSELPLYAGAEEAGQPFSRRFVIIFDFWYNTRAGVERMLDGAKYFVDSQLTGGDEVSIVAASPWRGILLLSPRTSDRRALIRTIDGVRPLRGGGWSGPDALSPSGGELLASVAVNEVANMRSESPADMLFAREIEDSYAEGVLREHLGALRRIAAELASEPGPKYLLLFSDGFPQRLLYQRPSLMEEVEKAARVLASAECHVYSFHTRGLYSPSNLGSIDRPEVSGRTGWYAPDQVLLAAQTGGSSYRNLNDFSKALGGVARMTSASYLLAYKVPSRPKDEKPDQFHRISVRTARRDVELKYRAGYLSTLDR